MKTIFDKATRDGLIIRIRTLNEDHTAQWGKMNVSQMVRHCVLFEEMMLGKRRYPRAFIGRLFGRIALRNFLSDDRVLGKNSPTLPELRVAENSDLAAEKERWIGLIEAYESFTDPKIVHPFFGKLTVEQVGSLVFKHTDHHLRQFNA